MSDIKVKLTEQSIGVPDTGSFIMLNSDNATGGINYGLLVSSFAVIAIIFTLVIVAVIKRAKRKKHSGRYNRFAIHSKTKTALSFSICIILASILIPIADQHFSNNQKTAQAATNALTISAEPISITAELKSDDTVTAVSSNVTVTSATTAGYTLGVYAASKDLVSPDNSIATKISGLSMDNTEPTALSPNTWGLATTAPTDSSSKVWRAISDSETAATVIKTTSTATPANNVTTVWYGINVNDKLEPSEYTDTINYIAVANVVSDAVSQLQCNPSGATISEIVCMQDINAANRISIFDSMVQDEQYQLYDSRDNKQYYVAKLADGNIWMTQNLDHNIGDVKGGTYTSADTDISSDWTPSSAEKTYATGTTTWNDSNTAPESYNPGDLCWNGTFGSYDLSTGATTCGDDKHMHIGNYYNWTAAVAMSDSSNYTAQNQDVDQSICPAGWMLPKSGTTLTGSGSFYNLVNGRYTAGTSGDIQNSPVYFVYGGYWGGSSGGVGYYGRYWSSVVRDGNLAYALYFSRSGSLDPQSYGDRNAGGSVRCVARDVSLPEEPEIIFDNVEWNKYGDVSYPGYLNACNGAMPEYVYEGSSYYATCEPDAGQHVIFPDSTSIKLIGSTGSAVSLGAYYDKIATDKAFSFQVDIDASSIGTHPTESGAFTIRLDAVDEDGQSLLKGIEASISSTTQTISINGASEEIALTSKSFTLLFTHQDGKFQACATEPGKEPQCISATKLLPVYALLKVDFNLEHGGHACSNIALVELHDVDIRLGNGAITF